MVLVQKWPFFNFFFNGNTGKENVFYDILEQKNAFLRYKNKKSKKPKTWHFSKEVNPWFLSKNGHFSNFFFLSNLGKENIFNDILKRKKAFLHYKKRSSKSRKIDIFSKGLTHGFGPRLAIIPTFFFKQFRKGKCLSQYSRTKKRLSTLQKEKNSKIRKIAIFPKGLTHGFGPNMVIFATFFFWQFRKGKCNSRYSRTKKRLSTLKKEEVHKVEKLTFFPRG